MRVLRRLQWLLLAVVIGQWGNAGWIYAKALLARHLIADAWAQTLAAGATPVKPWRWADTWPVARLRVPAREIDLYVLAGTRGNALAFGPGYDQSTAPPGTGASVIGGHRDTHFAFLASLSPGTEIRVQTRSGAWHSYRVTGARVADIRHGPLRVDPREDRLWLITCYPFDAIRPGGPLRYVVETE